MIDNMGIVSLGRRPQTARQQVGRAGGGGQIRAIRRGNAAALETNSSGRNEEDEAEEEDEEDELEEDEEENGDAPTGTPVRPSESINPLDFVFHRPPGAPFRLARRHAWSAQLSSAPRGEGAQLREQRDGLAKELALVPTSTSYYHCSSRAPGPSAGGSGGGRGGGRSRRRGRGLRGRFACRVLHSNHAPSSAAGAGALEMYLFACASAAGRPALVAGRPSPVAAGEGRPPTRAAPIRMSPKVAQDWGDATRRTATQRNATQ